jgi:glycosyltransferase involved in cell wall biosynthesis
MAEPALASDHGAAGQASGIAVIIPTLDEQESIADVVRSLPRAIVSRVIVADGGSRDATAQRAKAAGADVIDAGRGYGRACLVATMAAEDAHIVVFMDGDGADDPENVARLVEPIRAGCYDVVIGSRARGTAHSRDSRRLSPAARRQFQSCGKPHRHASGGRAHPRDFRPAFERDNRAQARTPARAFERAMIKFASSAHRHNVICFVWWFRLMLDG